MRLLDAHLGAGAEIQYERDSNKKKRAGASGGARVASDGGRWKEAANGMRLF
jgi:hypothetical protein